MKVLITILAAIIILLGCNDNKSTQHVKMGSCNELAEAAYENGYWQAAVNIIKMMNEGTYSPERFKSEAFKDSVKFSQFINK